MHLSFTSLSFFTLSLTLALVPNLRSPTSPDDQLPPSIVDIAVSKPYNNRTPSLPPHLPLPSLPVPSPPSLSCNDNSIPFAHCVDQCNSTATACTAGCSLPSPEQKCKATTEKGKIACDASCTSACTNIYHRCVVMSRTNCPGLKAGGCALPVILPVGGLRDGNGDARYP